MALKPNATMSFTSYQVEDGCIRLHFVCLDPGPGEVSDYYCLVTDAELSIITSLAEFRNLVLAKLQRSLRATGIATKLDPYIGRTLEV